MVSLRSLAILAALVFVTDAAVAKAARCFATDDGYFPCDFQMTDPDGSFEITGNDVTYILIMDQPGFAFAFVNLGHRNIPLAGQYVRQSDDPACWSNPETSTKICAW